MVQFGLKLSYSKKQPAAANWRGGLRWPSNPGRLQAHYLIHDRDPLFSAEFLNMIAGAGVESVKLPQRSPNLNAYTERFVRRIKESCLERIILKRAVEFLYCGNPLHL